jgi:hypothetical protein
MQSIIGSVDCGWQAMPLPKASLIPEVALVSSTYVGRKSLRFIRPLRVGRLTFATSVDNPDE